MSKPSFPQGSVRTRFAPSPTGEMHLGNARTALFCWLLARRDGGRFIVRSEDTDAERSSEASLQGLLADLTWLGLDMDEGPDLGGEHGPYRQSERQAIYDQHYEALGQAGRVYPCFCSPETLKRARRRQQAAGQPPRYPGTCRDLSDEERATRLAAGEAATLRFAVAPGERVAFEDIVRGEQVFESDDIGDFIIRRSDGTPAFFFSNAIDDALMGITHVLRGEDHLANTPRQLMLLSVLGLPAPAYGHLSLLVGDDGAPLSKRHGSASVKSVRADGVLGLALCNHLARLGCAFEDAAFMPLSGLASAFDFGRLGRAPARHDEAQLAHWQREAILQADTSALTEWLRGDEASGLSALAPAAAEALVGLVRDNVLRPADAALWVRQLGPDMTPSLAAASAIAEAGAGFFTAAGVELAGAEDYKSFTKALGKATGARGKGLFMPLRAALTGETGGPELVRLWDYFGREEIARRLQAAAALAEA